MIKRVLGLVAASALAFFACDAVAQQVFPAAGLISSITTGGTAQNALTGPANGCYIVNPLTATDQGVMTAEPLYVDPTGTAATTTASVTNTALAPGQPWFCVPYSGKSVSLNAATSGHKFTIVRW